MITLDPSENLHIAFQMMVHAAKTFPHLTNRQLRGMFTHWLPESLHPYNYFTGMVSEAAVRAIIDMKRVYKGGEVVREHQEKQQRTLTAYIGTMREADTWDFNAFETRVKTLGAVNITTRKENYLLARKNATYENQGIRLLRWDQLPVTVKSMVCTHLLNDIANRRDFIYDIPVKLMPFAEVY